MSSKLNGIKLEKAYEEKFNTRAPYFDLAAEYKPMEEWEEIMRKAIEMDRPYEVKYEPDVLY